jgi:DNA ligase-associated metallophosphoesterase
MKTYDFTLNSARLTALPSGALWWSQLGLLCVSDLHFGKSNRLAHKGRAALSPNENRNTLARLERDILKQNPQTIVCLGDSFDDLAAFEEMEEQDHRWLTYLIAGRSWVWIEGDHDPGPVDIGGTHLAQYKAGPLWFRHIADPDQQGEISGHFHPKIHVKTKGHSISAPCFVIDDTRVILPAYGTFTGGLRADNTALTELMSVNSIAVLTGKQAQPVPMIF